MERRYSWEPYTELMFQRPVRYLVAEFAISFLKKQELWLHLKDSDRSIDHSKIIDY